MIEEKLAIDKLTNDIKLAAKTLSNREARYIVDTYYMYQDYRIRSAGQVRSMEQNETVEKEPHLTIDWFMNQSSTMENYLKAVLLKFAENRTVGRWALGICGIGPVISAGLIAHISMEVWVCIATIEEKKLRKAVKDKCTKLNPCSKACTTERTNSVGRIWKYAGLDPTTKWNKGELRPWNANLKTLAWKIGQSFVKVSNNKNDFYGKFYKQRKELETSRNNEKLFADQAELILNTKNIGKTTDAYKAYSQGMLPPAHIQARSERYAVKLFLSHWHQVAYRDYYNESPPKPYVIDILAHKDMIQVPDYPWPDEIKL